MEIGGYFGIDFVNRSGKAFYPNLIALNCARNALLYIAEARGYKKIYIPYFLCDSVYKVCERNGIDFEYYDVTNDLRPEFDKELKNGECLYIVNYFGQLSSREIKAYKIRYTNIIVDNVQAFFVRPLRNIDTLYSCRKFFGVPDGAYAAIRLPLLPLGKDDSSGRLSHLFGRFEDGAKKHYADFQNNEDIFYNLPLLRMSDITRALLAMIPYNRFRRIREKNFAHLHRRLQSLNKLEIRRSSGPYAYPLYVENGNRLRKVLVEKGIFVPRLWPNTDETHTQCLVDNILPLPCDHRYGKKEMSIIVKEILDFYEKEDVNFKR